VIVENTTNLKNLQSYGLSYTGGWTIFSQNSLVSVMNEGKEFYIFHLIIKGREKRNLGRLNVKMIADKYFWSFKRDT
jgi:hypothetical protein